MSSQSATDSLQVSRYCCTMQGTSYINGSLPAKAKNVQGLLCWEATIYIASPLLEVAYYSTRLVNYLLICHE